MSPAEERELAGMLAALRRDGRQRSGLDPRLVPPDRDAAYRIAEMVAAELGWEVAGWKIAATNARMQAALRTDRPIYGRVFAHLVAASPHTVRHADQCGPIPEPEYVARLGAGLPPREAAYTQDEVAGAVESLHPGVELAECRFVHDEIFPPLPAILADGSGGGSLVLGPPIADWRDRDIPGQDVVLYCNGVERRRGTAADALDPHPLAPLTWLANELSRTGIGLQAGQVVSTGTLTGMLRPKPGETFVADFGPFGSVTATYS